MAIMVIIVPIFVLISLIACWKYFFIAPIKQVKAGYRDDINIPYSEPIELYHSDISACSMKVRMCLALSGAKFKSNIVELPSAGSWETKSSAFLCINPAGTVPVLVHNGHPIYESSEQIEYIAKHFVTADKPSLIPDTKVGKLLNDYWLEKTSWYGEELKQDFDKALTSRAGNCIPIISIPSFAAIVGTLSWRTIFKGLLVLGINDKQFFNFFFSFFGVHSFKFLPKLVSVVKKGKSFLLTHLKELDDHLKKTKTTFICGSDITLADIGWAPILERMEFVGWWEHIDLASLPYVLKYWENIKSTESYKEATKLLSVEKTFVPTIKGKLDEWKNRYYWFKKLYD